MRGDTLFDQVVFSGGGTRCTWQGGFMHVLRAERPIRPDRVVGVSGGALSACGFVTHRGVRVRDTMTDLFARHDRNLPLNEPFDGDCSVTPHQQMYRKVVEDCIGDDEALEAVADGPVTQIHIARPPSDDWAKTSGTAVALAYAADQAIRSTPHHRWPEAAGLTGEMVDANAAARDGRLVDLVCAAATIPPVFEPPLWDGAPAVDAGMVDKAPMPVPDRGRTLVLLTRSYRNLPQVEGRLYIAPSETVPADKIDFTDPDKLRRTWDLGEDDARRMLRDGSL